MQKLLALALILVGASFVLIFINTAGIGIPFWPFLVAVAGAVALIAGVAVWKDAGS